MRPRKIFRMRKAPEACANCEVYWAMAVGRFNCCPRCPELIRRLLAPKPRLLTLPRKRSS